MRRQVQCLLLIVLSSSLWSTTFAQILRGKSSALQFELNRISSKASATSEVLRFNSKSAGKTTAMSSILNFGKNETAQIEKPVSTVQQQTAVEEKKKDPLASNTQPLPKVSEPERKVEEVKSPPAEATATKSTGEELGAEYKNKVPAYYALIIGISDYKFNGQGIESLQNPVKDAEQLNNILVSQYNFPKDKVRLLKNATRQQIIDAFESLSAELSAKDNLLVFYAGHGFYDKTKDFGYWLPSDARTTSRSDWIPNSTVKDYLSAIKSKHTLLVTDACFAGSIFKTRAVDDYKTLKIYELYKYTSRKALTSGNLSEVPDRSVFMEQILKNLNENEEEYLPAQRLFIRIYEPVTNNSSGDPKFGVIQGAGDEGGDFIFIRKKK
jgi:hypothetical protein